MRDRRSRVFLLFVGVSLTLLWGPSYSLGLDDSNVLVLYNSASPDGTQVASSYAGLHPGVTVLGLQGVPTGEQISPDVYLGTIRPQVLGALTDSIDCIVTTKGLPLRIDNPRQSGDPTAWNRYSSLESELARIDTVSTRVAMGDQMYFFPTSAARNPYFNADAPFSYAAYGTRLTARLDGFSVADVTAALDRSQVVVAGLLNQHFIADDHPDLTYDRMPILADQVLAPRDLNYVYDNTTAFVADSPGTVLGYVSHGRHGGAPAGYVLDEVNGLRFQPAYGSIFHTYESFNALSFTEGANRYGQALVAEWLRRGGSAAVGHVEEPNTGPLNVTNEDRMFDMLLNGYTWAEAAWNATFQLSFVNTVVGDPLMRWLTDVPLGDANLDDIVDSQDFTIIKNSFGEAGGWSGGDFNGDGLIDGQDFSIFKESYSLVGHSRTTNTPEPATGCLLVVGLLAVLRRRRK